jgi:phosphohistidine phosphatase
MLRLTLVRHARAQAAVAGQEDWDRALDIAGHREAVLMGQRLHQRTLKPTCLASSTALRALSTAQLLARELGISSKAIVQDQRLYLIAATDLLDWIGEQTQTAEDLAQHLMIVAHNPGLSDFAARIAAQPAVDALPTCACYTLSFDIAHWRELRWGSGTDAELDYPQQPA